MTAEQRLNIFIDQGADFYQEFPYPDARAGDVAIAQVYRWAGGPVLTTFTATVDLNGLLVGLALTSSETAALTRSGWYELSIQNGASIKALYEGRAKLQPGSTGATAAVSQPASPFASVAALTTETLRAEQVETALTSGLNTEVAARQAMIVGGKLDPNLLPALALTETFVVDSQAAMLALVAQEGDVAKRTDIDSGAPFILAGTDPTVLGNWVRLTGDYALTTDLTTETQRAEAAEAVLQQQLWSDPGQIINPAGTAQVLNVSQTNTFDLTLSASNCAITLTGAPIGGSRATSILLAIRQGATGSQNISIASVTWTTGSMPSLKTAPGSTTFYELVTTDGVNWIGTGVITSVNGRTGDVTGLAEASDLTVLQNQVTASAPGSNTWLKEVTLATAFQINGVPIYDSTTGTMTAANIKWPDGTSGAYATTSLDGNGAVLGFTATYVGATTKTVTVAIPRSASSQVNAAMTASVA